MKSLTNKRQKHGYRTFNLVEVRRRKLRLSLAQISIREMKKCFLKVSLLMQTFRKLLWSKARKKRSVKKFSSSLQYQAEASNLINQWVIMKSQESSPLKSHSIKKWSLIAVSSQSGHPRPKKLWTNKTASMSVWELTKENPCISKVKANLQALSNQSEPLRSFTLKS